MAKILSSVFVLDALSFYWKGKGGGKTAFGQSKKDGLKGLSQGILSYQLNFG